jgi:hypothetical protein
MGFGKQPSRERIREKGGNDRTGDGVFFLPGSSFDREVHFLAPLSELNFHLLRSSFALSLEQKCYFLYASSCIN